jgi:hypothetical protein
MKKTITSMLLTALMCLSGTQAWAALTQVGGVYQIGTAQDLADFAALVNAGNLDVDACLTADIDYTTKYVQIGEQVINGKGFRGIFNGNGYTITVAMDSEGQTQKGNNTGLFYNMRGTVENLRVVGTVKAHLDNAGAICYYNYGVIRNCVAEVDFTLTKGASCSSGGFAGQAEGGSLFENCMFKGSFDAAGTATTNVGCLYGWGNGTPVSRNCLVIASSNLGTNSNDFKTIGRGGASVTNCYYMQQDGSATNMDVVGGDESKAATAEKLASGEIAYRLGATQTIGTETLPNLLGTSSKVYAVGSCKADDATNFTNNETGSATHTFSNLVCTVCSAKKVTADGFYEIGSKEDLVAFAALVNGGDTRIKGRLTADINMEGAAADTRIGTSSKRFVGVFDGEGHTISNLNIDIAGNDVGLFVTGPNVFLDNFFLDETCTIKGQNQTGVIGNHNGASGRFFKIGSAAKIVSTGENNGGLIGGCWCGNPGVVNIKSCWTIGTIETSGEKQNNCGQFCGWTNQGTINFSNCWSTATMNHWQDYDKFWARYGATLKFTNCYSTGGRQVQGIVADDVKSGRLCFLLNGGDTEAPIWFQTLGSDAQPTLSNTSGTVYASYNTDCDGFTPTATPGYSNTPTGMTGLPSRGHNYVADVCTQCGQTKANAKKYTISTGDQLRHFAYGVEAGNRKINATLAADINLEGVTLPIMGSNGNFFSGTFDGKGHAIHNYSLTSNEDYAGFFGMIYQATVKDFSIDGNMTLSGKNVGGLIGQTNSSNTISDVHSTLNITATGKANDRFGGIVGYAAGSATTITNCTNGGTMTVREGYENSIGGIIGNGYYNLTLDNCVFYGTFKALGTEKAGNAGGIVAYINSTTMTRINNCVAAGTVDLPEGRTFNLCRGIVANVPNDNVKAQMSKVTNCYYTDFGAGVTEGTPDDTKAETVTTATAEQVASGDLTYALNGNSSEGTWTQTIGTDATPMPNYGSEKVYKTSNVGWSTFFDTTANYAFNGVKAYTGKVNGESLTLTEVSQVNAGTPVVLEGYYYNKVVKATTAEMPENDLKGTTEDITADGSQYVLAKKDDVVGFYQATEGTIAAGKAYLTGIAAGVKAVTFGNATSLTPTLSEEREPAAVYDLSGRRVQKATKGLYIINGKKVLK